MIDTEDCSTVVMPVSIYSHSTTSHRLLPVKILLHFRSKSSNLLVQVLYAVPQSGTLAASMSPGESIQNDDGTSDGKHLNPKTDHLKLAKFRKILEISNISPMYEDTLILLRHPKTILTKSVYNSLYNIL